MAFHLAIRCSRSRLLHQLAQVAAADAGHPFERYARCSFQDDLRLVALAESMHVRRIMIVREHHEPEAVGAVEQ